MVGNVERASTGHIAVQEATRWQQKFGFSESEARRAIEEYRADLSRVGISDPLWNEVAAGKEAEGWDRESYEYSLTHHHNSRPHVRHQVQKGTFIVKLEGALNLEVINHILCLQRPPQVSHGHGEDGSQETFITIDGNARATIPDYLSATAPGFRATIIKIAKAGKDLNAHNSGPKIGLDTSLPQHLTQDARPKQDEYPVWYFFYGTLAEPERLALLLDLPEEETLYFRPATICGGKLRTWAVKYRALVDDLSTKRTLVSGHACLVQSKEHEDALRFYENDKYDAVRCDITFADNEQVVPGLTFRFCGEESDLD